MVAIQTNVTLFVPDIKIDCLLRAFRVVNFAIEST